MKKAKIILTAIAVFAIIGGALAFKASRYTEVQLWTINGVTTVDTIIIITTTVIIYTATVPKCTTTNRWGTDDGDVLAIVRLSSPGFVKGTAVGGTATTLIPYVACPTTRTFVTLII
jgi:hypothetical protein